MIFKDEHDFSLLPKYFFMAAVIFATLTSGYLMFADENSLPYRLKPYAINGDFTRQVILMFCLLYLQHLHNIKFLYMKIPFGIYDNRFSDKIFKFGDDLIFLCMKQFGDLGMHRQCKVSAGHIT